MALLVFANAMWGCSYAISKVALQELPPPLLGTLRVVGATSLLWIVLLWQHYQFSVPIRVPRYDALKLFAIGFCGISLDYLLGYWGVSLTTATDASLMIIGEVIFTMLLAVWLLGERLDRRKLAGIALGMAGVTTLVLGNLDGNGGGGLARAIGDMLLLGGLLGAALYSVLGTGLARRYHPLTILTYANTGSLLLWVPLLVWYGATGALHAFSMATMFALLYLVLGASLVGPIIWFFVLSKTNASLGAVTLFVQPLVGSLVGLLVLGDAFTVALMIGGALIFVALYLMTQPSREPTVEYELTHGVAK